MAGARVRQSPCGGRKSEGRGMRRHVTGAEVLAVMVAWERARGRLVRGREFPDTRGRRGVRPDNPRIRSRSWRKSWSPRKASRQSRPASLRAPPLMSRLVTWHRMSFSEPLVWSGMSGRSSTLSNSLLLALRRASRRSRVAKPVLWLKMRSKRADKVTLRAGDGWRRQALRLR